MGVERLEKDVARRLGAKRNRGAGVGEVADHGIDRSLGGTNLGYTLKTYTQGPFPVISEEPVEVTASSNRNQYDFIDLATDQASRYGYQSVLSPQ